jgi:RimJ/RimL family protein N-acetyltransferase
MGVIDKVTSRLRRDAGISVARTYLYRRAHTDAAPPDVAASVDRIARVRASDIESLCVLGFDDRDEWRQRLERGDQCYAAWVGSELVHYSWVQTRGAHPIASAGIVVPIRERELWIYNCRTSEQHRGQKIYPRTLQHILAEHFGAGATTAWIYTAEENIASKRGVERAGFTLVQVLRALRLGRRYRALDMEPADRSDLTATNWIYRATRRNPEM